MKNISKEQKSNLAKLLATENINVIHQKVETAYFIPKTRTLCLPIWEEMSNDLYDMLTGHEVGHALYTPRDLEKNNKYKIPHSYFNVVEDIRIDKKMKIKYPGLRRSYFRAYRELIEKDFFKTQDKDVNGMRFIDRLNIFFKSGTDQEIDFNEQEQEFIERAKQLNTWNDVVKLVKDIYAYSGTEKFDEEQEEEMRNELGQGQGDQEQEQSEQSEGNGDSDEQQEQNQETTSSSGSDNDKQEDEQSSAGSNSKEEKENKEESKGKSSGPEGGYKVGSNEALTDHANEQNKKSMAKTDKDIKENIYLQLPKCKDAVVPYDLISKKIEKINSKFSMADRIQAFKKFKNQQMRTVNYMVKEFEMKKAADAYVRTRTARTGVINTNTLHSYKYNDDIFARVQIEPGAKNHGMIMIVDWSGSMGDKMYDTLVQTMNLVMFCKAVNIPFAVYAFSDTNKESFTKPDDEYVSRFNNAYERLPYHYDKEGLLMLEDVSLLEFVNSDMKNVKYQEAMANLYQIALEYHIDFRANRHFHQYENEENYNSFYTPSALRLGGTPLDSAIYQSVGVVNKFIQKNKIQKMNTIFLTDGSGHTMGKATMLDDHGKIDYTETYMYDVYFKDGTRTYKYGGGSYRSHHHGYHKQFLNYFKHKTGSTVIGYYVCGRKLNYWDVNNFSKKDGYAPYEDAKTELRKNKVVTFTDIGYDELFITTKNNIKIDDTEAEISSDMTASKMKQAWAKSFKQKKMSRVLLNKFVERVA